MACRDPTVLANLVRFVLFELFALLAALISAEQRIGGRLISEARQEELAFQALIKVTQIQFAQLNSPEQAKIARGFPRKTFFRCSVARFFIVGREISSSEKINKKSREFEYYRNRPIMCYSQCDGRQRERSENALENKPGRVWEIASCLETDSRLGGSRMHSGSYYSLNIAFKDMDFTYSDIYRD